jgi:hypothetical protein
VTTTIHVDLRPNGVGPAAQLSPWGVQRAILNAIEDGAAGHCISRDFADGTIPPDGVYVAYHLRLDVEIVVDNRTPEERS